MDNLPTVPIVMQGNLISRESLEFLWSICQQHNTKKYEAMVYGFSGLCFAIKNLMSHSAAYFLRIFAVVCHVVMLTYLVYYS